MNKSNKMVYSILITLLLVFLAISCGGPPDNGHVGPIGTVGPVDSPGPQAIPSDLIVIEDTGVIISKEYPLSDFTRLEISDGFDVTVNKDENFRVNTRFEETAIPFIEIYKDNETLIIMLKPDKTYNMVNITLDLEISMPELKEIVLKDGADATIKGLSGYTSEVDFLSNLYQ